MFSIDKEIIDDDQKLRDRVVKELIESNIDIQKYLDFVENRIANIKKTISNYEPTTYLQDIIADIKDAGGSLIYEPAGPLTVGEEEVDTAIMWNYKLSVGLDERGYYISYYDIWDLSEIPIEGEESFIGNPFEIYDRIYYDHETFEIISE